MANVNMTDVKRFLFGAARFRFYFSYHIPLTLLSRLGRFLFLVAAGFLLIVLIACAGGGGGSANNGLMDGDPGDKGQGNGGDDRLGVFNASITFAPIRGGFQISSQSDFSNFISLNITATSGSEVVERSINIDEFADDSYDFTGLADRDWKFQISGILSDSREQEVNIVFVWQENRDDHSEDGIRSGVDTDGDRRANSVDDDDDNDGLDDVDEPSGCELDSDCDDDDVRDGDEVAAECVQDIDCDDDGARDGDEEAGCVQNTDCDNDGVGDGIEARGCAKLEDCDNDNSMDGADIDDDGDGLIEIRTADELDAVRHQLDGSGYRSTASGNLNQTGCGGDGDIRVCKGYELVANISLADYADDGGKGWQPLGHDTNGNSLECQGDAFDGTFDGNGFMISDLNISRSDEDCVGLFGHLAADSAIRNLTIRAEAVTGRNRVGTLVGDGSGSRIVSSSIMVGEVKGDNAVGGLVGLGSSARIASSSVVATGVVSEISDFKFSIGGLVGSGMSVWIHSSSVVLGSLRGGQSTGGLVGDGSSARIHSSSVIAGEVRGASQVGGLMGSGGLTQIVSSSVVVGEVTGSSSIGGLAGSFASGKVAYSYVVSGSPTPMLAGTGSGVGNASYWDSETSGRGNGNHGQAKTTSGLSSPTGYADIYATWSQDMGIFGDEDEPLAVWCDKDNSGNITMDERENDNRVWNFGTNMEYPAIECTPIAPAEWRAWWFLNASGKPQLDRARLDDLLQ